jgi:hypothetical protein
LRQPNLVPWAGFGLISYHATTVLSANASTGRRAGTWFGSIELGGSRMATTTLNPAHVSAGTGLCDLRHGSRADDRGTDGPKLPPSPRSHVSLNAPDAADGMFA